MKDYHTHHTVVYEPEEDAHGWTSIDVLEFLKGKPWDEVALAYVSSLRPSAIRVTTGMQTCDGYTWRVTVIVDDKDIIRNISQEVDFDSTPKVRTGSALDTALSYGLNSKQVDWYDDDRIDGFVHDGINHKYYKSLKGGGMVPFPKND